jgi:hypothetical protein
MIIEWYRVRFREEVSAFSRLHFAGVGITFKSAPSETPAVEFGDRNRRGTLILLYTTNRHGATGREKKLCPAEKK